MVDLNKYAPYICIGALLFIIFIIWVFWSGDNYQFVGLDPLNPDKMSNFVGNNSMICINDKKSNNNTQNTQNTQNLEVVDKPKLVLNIIPDEKKKNGVFVSKGQQCCKDTMIRIYGVPFESFRPNWLKNPETNRNMELDCYNDNLKIAVEYNGIQHYTWPNFTNQTREQFLNQVRRDKLKVELCDNNGVYLITVPYHVSFEDIPAFIIKHLPESIQNKIQEEQNICK